MPDLIAGLDPSTDRLRFGSQVGCTLYIHSADDPKGRFIGSVFTPELAALIVTAVNDFLDLTHPATARDAAAGPLSATCPACLAEPGQQCFATSTDEPRRHPHRLRGLAAAKHLAQCRSCGGIGWRPADTFGGAM